MMKLFTTMGKNLKLLFRNKESAYTIVFGPILIIMLVSIAFSGSSEVDIDLGVYIAGESDLAHKTIERLNENHKVNVFGNVDECITSVEAGTTHACIVFEAEKNDVTPVTFYLDFSRMDLVYVVLDELSQELDVGTDVLREQLAQEAIQRMETSAQIVEESLEKSEKLKEEFQKSLIALHKAKEGMDSIPTEMINITDLQPLSGLHLGLASNAQYVADESMLLFEEAKILMQKLQDECEDCPEGLETDVEAFGDELDELESEIFKIIGDTQPELLEQAQLTLRFAMEDIASLEGAISNMSEGGEDVADGVDVASASLENSVGRLNRIISRLTYTRDFLRGQETDASSLSVPVLIKTENIGFVNSTVTFAYPYLLMLVIMFIGILLSSMLVVTDKTSKARFRNFTTPTSDIYHVLVSFFTAFCILAVEVLVILILSTSFVAKPLFLNMGSTITIIGLAIVIFTFVGMLIGYLSSSQEASMITSITISSVLLFVSNVVQPEETLSSMMQFINSFNPYIVLSELLRRSMLYGVTFNQASQEIMILAGFIVFLLIITVFVQRRIKRAYFKDEQLIPKLHKVPAPLRLGARVIYNEVDLIDALDRMTRDEFQRLIPIRENIIVVWASTELRNKSLARKLRTTSKERMILKLDKYLKRHGKNLKR